MDFCFLNERASPVTTDEIIAAMKSFPFDEDDRDMIDELAAEAAEIARPKAALMRADITDRGEGHITMGHIRFNSSLVSNNVTDCPFIVPYICTCGRELYRWSIEHKDDILEEYICDLIMELYLRNMCSTMKNRARELYFDGEYISSMAPGSLIDEWPINEQAALFRLLGEHGSKTGVTLTDTFLMIPNKSVSGFYFKGKEHFENCMLCPRVDCPSRRAEYKK